jgi:EpsI family protein
MTRRLAQLSTGSAVAILVAAFLSAVVAILAQPSLTPSTNVPSLESTIPRNFGDWREIQSPFIQVALTVGDDPTINQPYDQTIARTYRNGKNQVVHLALAWGANQRQEVKVHQPRLCYLAQGFKIMSLEDMTFDGIQTRSGIPVRGKHMIAQSNSTVEAVGYWIRIGDLYSEDSLDTRWKIFRDGLRGRVPDGILVRASMTGIGLSEQTVLFPLIDTFLEELVASVTPSTRDFLIR